MYITDAQGKHDDRQAIKKILPTVHEQVYPTKAKRSIWAFVV